MLRCREHTVATASSDSAPRVLSDFWLFLLIAKVWVELYSFLSHHAISMQKWQKELVYPERDLMP